MIIGLFLFLQIIIANAQSRFKVTFHQENQNKIQYVLVNQAANQTRYLNFYCQHQHILNVFISESEEIIEMPHYNIYDETNFKSMSVDNITYAQCSNFKFQIPENQFNLKVYRKFFNDNPLFQLQDFNFSNKFVLIKTKDNSIKWGFGQRFQHNFHVKNGLWTIWNRDRPWVIDTGSHSQSKQTYGHQPLYLARNTDTKKFHLAYLKSTYPMNVQVQNQYITYHVTGGHIHFVIFLGNSDPQIVLKDYHNYIGASYIPPFWGMGWHQCRWGYKSVQVLKRVVDKYKQHNLPIDTIWTDLDYMHDKQDFTVDQNNFPLYKFRELLKQVHYIPLIDAGISLKTDFAMRKGNQLNVWIKNFQKQNYQGSVWPGDVYYVDFLHPNSTQYWVQMLNILYGKINFSGLWLDMNQMSNFVGGRSQRFRQQYRIQHSQPLSMMTIDPDALFYNSKNPEQPLLHQQVHAYYGHLQSRASFEFFKKKQQRPLIITRSNSVGTGKYAGHWTGDNVASWEFLRLSISGNFLFQIFGMQMVGADVCGFQNSTTEQLCSRWMQLGALYPFARNHNQLNSRDQQPYAFGPLLLQTSKLSLNFRYQILKHYYSIFVKSKGLGSIYRPLLFQFPNDQQCYKPEFMQEQFLVGNFLMGVPILSQGSKQKEAYFPQSSWFSLTGQQFSKKATVINSLPAAPSVFIRSGYILFSNSVKTRTKDIDNVFSLKAAFKQKLNKSKSHLRDQNDVTLELIINYISQGYIMSISNYENNRQIELCIKDSCFYDISITINNMKMVIIESNFNGPAELDQGIVINQIQGFLPEKQFIIKLQNLDVKIKGKKFSQSFTLNDQNFIKHN